MRCVAGVPTWPTCQTVESGGQWSLAMKSSGPTGDELPEATANSLPTFTDTRSHITQRTFRTCSITTGHPHQCMPTKTLLELCDNQVLARRTNQIQRHDRADNHKRGPKYYTPLISITRGIEPSVIDLIHFSLFETHDCD
jgi:hypothetical protein